MNNAIALAERNVPRYTSYPTAPHFTPAVDAATYAGWLAALGSETTLSLYIHVPFCTQICLYCGCHTKAVRRSGPLDHYAARLMDEIELVASALNSRRVVHLHWGGGTPSILGKARLAEIMDKLAARFDLSGLIEHAIELDPRRMSRPLARALAELGVNRASLGVQDFTPQVQEAIGRVQPFAMVQEAAEWLRESGVERINIDLMYGLPRQTLADVEKTAALAASLRPARLALFGYAHVPWFKTHQRLIDAATLPGPAARVDQVRVASRTLRARGYEAIGLDHFALPDDSLARAQQAGRLRRNFQGYTTDEADELIGLGASAIGRLRQGFVQNAVDIAGYSRAVESGAFAAVKGVALTADDRMRGAIIERLMCDLAVDLDAFRAEGLGGLGAFARELDELSGLVSAGVVRVDGARVSVTERGRPFVRLVAAVFDAYLPQNRSRHSIAV